MATGPSIDEQIVHLHRAGHSQRVIAVRVHRSREHVRDVLYRWRVERERRAAGVAWLLPDGSIDAKVWLKRAAGVAPDLRWLVGQAKRRDERCGIKNRYVVSGRR